METNVSTNPVPSPGILGTKIPSTVVFTIGILLFLMPFAELKCNQPDTKTDLGGFNLNLGGQMTVSNTGVGLAFGSEWEIAMNGLGGMLSGNDSKMNKEQPKQDPNYYAIAALALGIIGLIFSVAKMIGGSWIAMLAGILSAAALIGLRFDLDKKVKDPSQVVENNENSSEWLNGLDTVKFELTYTSWYYIAVLAMIAAAVLCYLRIKSNRVG